MHREPPVRRVHMPRKRRIFIHQQRPIRAEILEMMKYQLRTTTLRIVEEFLRADSDPRELAGNAVTPRFVSHSSNTDYGIKIPRADSPHAISIAKHACARVRIAAVCPLVNQRSHGTSR